MLAAAVLVTANGGERRRRGHRHGGKGNRRRGRRARRHHRHGWTRRHHRRRPTPARGIAGGAGGQQSCPGTILAAGASPPQPLALTGSLGAHDPAALVVNSTIYLFATGLTSPRRRRTSPPGRTPRTRSPRGRRGWRRTSRARPTCGRPTLSSSAASTISTTRPLRSGATTRASATRRKAPHRHGSWTDQGTVVCSNMGTSDNWNAIDPNIVIDDGGTPWMEFGSFWGGVKMIRARADRRPRAEARWPTRSPTRPQGGRRARRRLDCKRCGYYYLFDVVGPLLSGANALQHPLRPFDVGEQGLPSTRPALKLQGGGGGTLVLPGDTTVHAPGHNAVIVYNNKTYNLYHALQRVERRRFQLHITELVWDADGWPVQHDP